MTTQVESFVISLESTGEVEVDGFKIPAGRYPGSKKRLGVPFYAGQVQWGSWEYWVRWDGKTLNATAQVAAGKLAVLS